MRRHQRGLSLAEMLVSLAVLFIGVTAAVSTIGYASRSTGTAGHMQQATAMAQSLLTTLLAVPYSTTTTGGASLFANASATNDTDVADSASAFTSATLPSGAYDHEASELPTSVAAMVVPATASGLTYERYWNIAPVGTNGVAIAVIVRWHESTGWQRTVVVGTRYAP